MFDSTSRYYHVQDRQYITSEGRTIAYKQRRFLPQGGAIRSQLEVTVLLNDRLDRITYRTLGDPQQFWRMCDANNAMNPSDLTAQPGRVLRIPNPQI